MILFWPVETWTSPLPSKILVYTWDIITSRHNYHLHRTKPTHSFQNKTDIHIITNWDWWNVWFRMVAFITCNCWRKSTLNTTENKLNIYHRHLPDLPISKVLPQFARFWAFSSVSTSAGIWWWPRSWHLLKSYNQRWIERRGYLGLFSTSARQ